MICRASFHPLQTHSDIRTCQAQARFISSELEPEMRKIPNSRRLDEHISRALNKIRKPSTAEEITELLNRELELEDRPFQTKEVAEWLRNTGDTTLTLYWSRTRPRR
jgi:hypothetical protein